MYITKNFTYAEFFKSSTAKIKGFNNVPPVGELSIVYANIIKMAFVLQRVRNNLDAPLTISSGYRCPALNQAVGGVSNSLHLIGLAADIPYTAENKAALKRAIDSAQMFDDLEQEYLFKVIDEKGWYHIQLNRRYSDYSLDAFIRYVLPNGKKYC